MTTQKLQTLKIQMHDNVYKIEYNTIPRIKKCCFRIVALGLSCRDSRARTVVLGAVRRQDFCVRTVLLGLLF